MINSLNTKATSEEELKSKINLVFQPLISEMMVKQPKDTIKFMLDYLLKLSGEKHNDNLIKELNTLRKIQSIKDNYSSNDEFDLDFTNDKQNYIDVISLRNRLAKKKRRKEISSQTFGLFNKENLIDLNDELIDASSQLIIQQNLNIILSKMKNFFFFKSLSDFELKQIALKFDVSYHKHNENILNSIINQQLFIFILEGEVDIYTSNTEGNEGNESDNEVDETKFIHTTLRQFDYYADLFLPSYFSLKNKINIISKTKTTILHISYETVAQIVKQQNRQKLKEFNELLLSIEFFKSNYSEKSTNELYQLAKFIKINKDDYVIQRDDNFNGVFLIQFGSINSIDSEREKVIYSYKQGDIFGDISLSNENKISKYDYKVTSNQCNIIKLDKKVLQKTKEENEVYLQFN